MSFNAGYLFNLDNLHMLRDRNALPFIFLLVSALSACGGGSAPTAAGGSASPALGGNTDVVSLAGNTVTVGMGPAIAPPADTGMTMACIDGTGIQCSGNTILKFENAIALTSSGVQAYGKSTNDLAPTIANAGIAAGLMPASGGIAEIRVAKSAAGDVTSTALLLRNLGIFWDGRTERPQIIETFSETQGRAALDASGKIIFGSLPDSSEVDFYDFAVKGVNATLARYANNFYFPRDLNKYPIRCPRSGPNCGTAQIRGFKTQAGSWRTGGVEPDASTTFRLHEDGDVHAGDDLPNADGSRKYLPGGSGLGVPFPGSKGFRTVDNWSFRYSNLATWFTQDTVELVEYTGASNEHNQSRRGAAAFGDVTPSSAVPGTGLATYSGFAYGWYTPNATDEPSYFRGPVTITVNFATRQAIVSVQNAATFNDAQTPVAANFTTTTTWTADGSANYMTGAVAASSGSPPGGVSARYFGPVTGTGASAGPAETGGAFSLSNPSTGEMVLGGFIARKQ